MSEPEEKKNNLEELLRMREQLDQELRTKYTKEVTILFTDIKGSTHYFETRGDLAGRAMVQAHNDMLFPIIDRHGGRLVKTIGDAIMASFQVPQDAVETAVDMQRVLAEHNRKKEEAEKISVRIGINTGLGIVEEKDVYGDVVNSAARVESLADGGEILVSNSVYAAVKNSDDIILRYHSTAEVKGKKEPIEVYRVVWQEELETEGYAISSQAAVRGGSSSEEERVLTLEFTRVGDKLKLSASERSFGQEKTLRHYEEKPMDTGLIDRLCAGTISLLNRANKRGKVSKEILVQLKESGQQLYDALMTPKSKELVASTKAGSLILNIDDHLVHIPWELLYDGADFLCQRFAMGRIVATRQSVAIQKQRKIQRPVKMLVLSDPKGDLQASYQEGVAIRDEMDKLPKEIIANLRTGPITADYVRNKMRNYDILHYAGHADYDGKEPGNSGWLLDGGKVSARDVLEMSGSQPMPALVFSNACHSGQTEEWSLEENYSDEIFGLANAFLLTGVQHYIGTFWEILDEPSAFFAIHFYGELMRGASIGRSLLQARRHLIKKYGEETIVWGSYMLYGDPTYMYRKETQAMEAFVPQMKAQPEPEPALAAGPARSTTAAVAVPMPVDRKNNAMLYAAAAVVVLVVGVAGAYMYKKGAAPAPSTAPTAQQQAQSGTSGPSGNAAQGTGGSRGSGLPGRGGQVGQGGGGGTAAPVAIASRENPAQDNGHESSAKKERIRQLAKELVARYKETGGAAPAEQQGNRPITVAFIGFASKGGGGDEQFLLAALQDKVMGSGKVQVVERELLESVLEELHLSTSDLADQKTALRLGKVLAARYITTGTLYASNGEYRVSMRLIETETTSLKGAFTESGKGNMDVNKVADSLGSRMVDKLTKENK